MDGGGQGGVNVDQGKGKGWFKGFISDPSRNLAALRNTKASVLSYVFYLAEVTMALYDPVVVSAALRCNVQQLHVSSAKRLLSFCFYDLEQM